MNVVVGRSESIFIGYLIFRSSFLPRIPDGVSRCGLRDIPVEAARNLSVPLQSCPTALGETSLTLGLLTVGENVSPMERAAQRDFRVKNHLK
jgi:hypothetical protein